MVFPAGVGTAGKILTAADPFIRAAVLERYGENVDQKNTCPGEKSCEIFQSAAGKSRAAKERNACRRCELFDTKTERYRESQKGLSELVNYSQYARRRRDSGYPMPLSQISDLMLETVLRLDEYHEIQERRIRLDTKQAIIVGLGLKTK